MRVIWLFIFVAGQAISGLIGAAADEKSGATDPDLALVEKWRGAAEAGELMLEDRKYETETIRLTAKLASIDRRQAATFFCHACDLLEAAALAKGWEGANAGNGWLTRSNLLGEVMNDVGVPKGVYNVVHGFGPNSAGAFLTEHPGVDAITFTGETRTGTVIMKAAGDDAFRGRGFEARVAFVGVRPATADGRMAIVGHRAEADVVCLTRNPGLARSAAFELTYGVATTLSGKIDRRAGATLYLTECAYWRT